MAAINVNKNNRTQRITLSSSEFPGLKVEGKSANESGLRKQLNAMMREKRRKSGGPTGKSPTEKVKKAPEETQEKKADTYQGYKSDIAFINKQKEKKKIDQKKFNRGPALTSAIPEKPDPKKSGSALPHIRRRQEIEAKRKKESQASQLAPKTGPVMSERNHPSRIAEDRKIAQEKGEVEQAGRLQAGETSDAQRKQIKKPSFMSQRKWDAIPVSQRRKVLENIRKTEEKAAIKGEVVSDIGREASHILSAASPISWVNPADNKYTMGRDINKKFREKVGLAQPEKTEEKVSELTDMDSEAQESQALQQSDSQADENNRMSQDATTDVTNEDGGLMKTPERPKTGEISEEPVKYDENGYPIYAKGSKKAADWNAAYAAAPVGEFMWDGRKYLKEGKPEEDEKAAVATQDSMTGDASVAEELGAPEHPDSEAQESQAFQQSDAQAEENENIAQKIVKIKERTSDYESRHREIQDVVKPLNKEDTASSKEAAGDWYVDPWTGFAIDLNKLQARTDRKDAMEFAALLPADQRAAYLSQEGLIEPEDLEKLLEPSELEQLQLQQAEVSLKTASYNLVTAELKRKDYRTPEQIADADLKKTVASEGRGVAETIASEKRAENTQIRKEGRTAPSNKAQLDRYAGLFKNAITNDDFAGQVYWGELMGLPRADMEKLAKKRMAHELKVEKKEGGSAFKEIFEFEYSKVLTDRKGLLMGTASLWTTGQIDIQMGDKQIKSREGLLNTLGIEDFGDMRNMAEVDPEEGIRMISGQSDLAIFRNPDYQGEDGNPDWLSILEDEDVYKKFVLDNAVYKGMNTIYGGEYADIRTYEAKRRKKRHDKGGSLRKKTTTNQN